MTDIVERLRSWEVFIDVGDMTSPVAHRAANEIERLREALRECVEVWRPLLADADLTAHENPAFLALMRADLALLENNRD